MSTDYRDEMYQKAIDTWKERHGSLVRTLRRAKEERAALEAEVAALKMAVDEANDWTELAKAERDRAVESYHAEAEEADRLREGLAALKEHERQTHETLGTILGTDDSLEQKAKALKAERDRLRDWKESAMALEATWDIQAVGKALGVPLGEPIHPAVLPGIIRLREALEEIDKHNPPGRHSCLSPAMCHCPGCIARRALAGEGVETRFNKRNPKIEKPDLDPIDVDSLPEVDEPREAKKPKINRPIFRCNECFSTYGTNPECENCRRAKHKPHETGSKQ